MEQPIEIQEEIQEVMGAMVLDEEVNMIALRKIRDNFAECFKRLGSVWIKDKDFEYKETDEKTAFTLVNNYYNAKLKSNKVEYGFLRRLKSGRRFATLSLQGLSRKIRHTIAKDIYDDIDMKNAHPTFCYYECKKLEFNHPILEEYVTKRDECLHKWIGTKVGSKLLMNKDEVKEYFLKLLNGGGNDQSSSVELNLFFTTHQKFMDLIFKHPNYKRFRDRAINKYKEKGEKKFDNRKGTCINYLFCDIENKALTEMELFLQENEIRYGALCFDGIMVYKRDVKDLHQLLTDLEFILHKKMGFPLKLAVKAMTEDIDISDLDIHEDIKTTDEDYALYILDKLKDDLLYDSGNKQMIFWCEEEALWREHDKTYLRTLISQILTPYIETSPDPKIVEREIASIKSNMRQSAITTMCEPYIRKRRDDEFITQNMNCKKGLFPIADKKIVELRTGLVRDRKKDDYYSITTTNRIVDISAVRDEMLKYYADLLTTVEGIVPSNEHRDCLIYTFAYSLTSENHLKRFVNFIGERDGGKSLCMSLQSDIMGEFGGCASERLFVAQKNKAVHDSEMLHLKNKKMTFVTETKESDTFNEEAIKKITGGDRMSVRGAGDKKSFDMLFMCILFLITNKMCKFTDEAFKDRLLCFNFCNQFKKDASVPIRIAELRNHFFTLQVEYAKRFYDNKLQINWSSEVIKYTEEIKANADPFNKWLSIGAYRKSTDDSSFVKKEEVYDHYLQWCISEKIRAVGATSFHKKFSDEMKIQSKKMMKKIGGFTEQFQGYEGIMKDE